MYLTFVQYQEDCSIDLQVHRYSVMASGSGSAIATVRGAICHLLTISTAGSDRITDVQEEVKKFLKATTSNQTNTSKFDDFSYRLTQSLEKCFIGCITDKICRSKNVLREKMWSSFHKLRSSGELSTMWTKICKEMDCPTLSPLIYQMATQKLFADMIAGHFSKSVVDSTVNIPALTNVEDNVVRYIAGYVPFKMLSKYEKRSSKDSYNTEVVECLHSMAVNGEESSLIDYTREWCLKVDRGGLFEVNDTAYLLFRIIELRVRKHLLISFSKGSTLDEINKREVIVSAVAADDDVQFYWTLLSVDITNEQIAIDLLKEMIGMWITIRGFSIAKAWLEKYMPEKKSKQKALRKELKSISTPSECT